MGWRMLLGLTGGIEKNNCTGSCHEGIFYLLLRTFLYILNDTEVYNEYGSMSVILCAEVIIL